MSTKATRVKRLARRINRAARHAGNKTGRAAKTFVESETLARISSSAKFAGQMAATGALLGAGMAAGGHGTNWAISKIGPRY